MDFRATYRLQLRGGLDFDHVARLADYLADLGVSHVYLSPIFKAVKGSSHGYDVVDPRTLDPELGGDQGYTRMVAALRDRGLGQLVDIVPNHMATDAENPWWWDLLTNGPSSRYARFFDIDWEGPRETSWSKVLVPILGDHYGRALEDGDLELSRQGAGLEIRYAEHRLPLSPESTSAVLSPAAHRVGSPELAELAEQLRRLPTVRGDSAASSERHQLVERARAGLEQLLSNPEVAAAIDAEAKMITGDVDRLHDLLDEQNYRLAHWKTASEEIDYRRFFSIETLVGVKADEPDVLAETHSLVFDLSRDGSLDGLRVDHIDGIGRPARYLEQLNEATGGIYTVVEKILEEGEELPADWPVAGTTGYDFLNRVNSVFVDPGSEERMTEIYETVIGETADYADVLHASKRHILDTSLAAELHRLTGVLAQLASQRRRHRDHTRRALQDALAGVIAGFGVYRLYVTPENGPSTADRLHTDDAIAEAMTRNPDHDRELLELIGELALGQAGGEMAGEFARQFQQLTAPVMAKGAEDTAFYRYNRLLSLNEVGGDPGRFGIDVATFHRRTEETLQNWPETLLTIGTHDTKRSPDVRARLNVLAEIPDAWEATVTSWTEMNDQHRHDGEPDANTEYHFYQTLVGAWPIDADRVRQYMSKAVREAKMRTSWMRPDLDYEAAVEQFVLSVMGDDGFVASLQDFLRDNDLIARGHRNSLCQVGLLLTCPGVPDLYQGSELWDLSLVDPDNRRPVNYDVRRKALARAAESTWPGTISDGGAAKMWLTRRLLHHGKNEASDGYEPLRVRGNRATEVVAYRCGESVAVIPVRSDQHWEGSSVVLPSGRWHNLLTDDVVEGGPADLGGLLGPAPLAVMIGDT